MVLPDQKIAIVEKVLNKVVTVTAAAKEAGVARKTIYVWIDIYKSKPRKKVRAFEVQYKKGNQHPRAKYPVYLRRLKCAVIKHPAWSIRLYRQYLSKKGLSVSHVSVYDALKRLNLATKEERFNYSQVYSGPGRLDPSIKLSIVRRVIAQDKSVSELAKEFKIARKTIYKWIEIYQNTHAANKNIFEEKYVVGQDHPAALYPAITPLVLAKAASNPLYSVHSLAGQLPISSWTVWSILNRYNLNSKQARLAFAAQMAERKQTKPVPVFNLLNSFAIHILQLIKIETRKIPKFSVALEPIKAESVNKFYSDISSFTNEFFNFITGRTVATGRIFAYLSLGFRSRTSFYYVTLILLVTISFNLTANILLPVWQLERTGEKTLTAAPTPITKDNIAAIQSKDKEFKVKQGDVVLAGAKSFKTTDKPKFTIAKQTGVMQKAKEGLTNVLGVSDEAYVGKPEVAVSDSAGNNIGGVELKEKSTGEYEVSVTPAQLKPGKYTINIKDESGTNISQDFTWGVLAINTNKSIYNVDETAKLALAVLDEAGNMVCDASLALAVTNTQTKETNVLSTADGDIKVNPECYKHTITNKPDYEAVLKLEKKGLYEMSLTADTKNGRYTISDYFDVSEAQFDTERYTGTRIYPLAEYPVVFTVKPKVDFQGIVEESVPSGFKVRETNEEELNNYYSITDIKLSGNVKFLGEKAAENEIKTLSWEVDWKKGETYHIAYIFDAPDTSPDFYLLGPLIFVNEQGSTGNILFSETRQWQLAIDAVPSGVIVAWPSTNALVPTGQGWTRLTGLDTYYLEGTTSDPSSTPGGAVSHTHTSPTHTHTIPDHTHTGSTNGISGTYTTTSSQTGTVTVDTSHSHSYTTGSLTGITDNNSQSVTLETADNNPPHRDVIWIQSNGSADIPSGAWAFYTSDSLPASWSRQAGNTYLKGAGAGADGTGTGGSASHDHTEVAGGHTHTENAHGHSTGTGYTGTPTFGLVGGSKPGSGYSNQNHTHPVSSIGTTAATENANSTLAIVGSDSSEPPYIKLNVVQNDTGGGSAPANIIALWTGTVAAIPSGWEVCDGSDAACPNMNNLFVKGANANGESGTVSGGSTSHSHGTGNSHDNSINSHSHSVSPGADSGNEILNFKTGTTIVSTGHSHTMGSFSDGSGTTGTATITADTSTTETRPPFKEAVFIRKPPLPVISGNVYNYGTSNALTECDHVTPDNNILVRAGGATYTTSCNDTTGAWSVELSSSIAAGGIIVWIDGEVTKGAGVIYYDGTADSANNVFYDDSVTVTSDNTTAVTNTHMDTYDGDTGDGDGGDTDIPYTVTAGALSVSSNHHLVASLKSGVAADSDVFDPGGTVTTNGTGNLVVQTDAHAYLDTATSSIGSNAVIQSSATLDIDATSTISGDITVAGLANLDSNITVNGGDVTVTLGGDVASATGTLTMGSSGTIGGGSVGSTFQLTNLTISSGTTTLGADADNVLVVNQDVSVSDGAQLAFNNKTLDVNGGNVSTTGTGSITCTGCNSGGLTLSGDGITNGIGGGTGGITFYNLTLDGTINTTAVGTNTITVSNDLSIGLLRTLSSASSGTINVGGDWTNNGSFTANSGSVVLNSTANTTQTVDGNTTFYNLTATTGDRVINFGGGDTFMIGTGGAMSITGDSCTGLIVLRSTDGTTVNITKTGSISLTFSDYQDLNVSAAGATVTNSVDSGSNTNLSVSANACSGASTDSTGRATGFSFQRKNFYDATNSVYWGFYHDGDEIEPRASTNSTTWKSQWSPDIRLSYDTNDFSVFNKTISATESAVLAVKSGDDIVVRRGNFTKSGSDPLATWESEKVAMNGTGASDTYSYAYATLDTSNNIWVMARYFDGTNYSIKVIRSNNPLESLWSEMSFSGTPTKISDDDTSSNTFGNIVPLGSGNLYATFITGTSLEGCKWTNSESSWKDSSGNSCVTTTGGDSEGEGTRSTSGAVKIDDAGNSGSLFTKGRQIVQTSAGLLYTVLSDNNYSEVWKSTDGTTWAEQDSGSANKIGCTSQPALVIDSTDIIHIICQASGIKYNTYNTSADQYGTSVESIGSGDDYSIAIDSANKPHVLYTSGGSSVKYDNRVSGTWKSSDVTVEYVIGVSFIGGEIIVNEDNIPEVVYRNSSDSSLTAAVANKNDPTQTSDWTVVDIDTTASGNSTGSIGIDTDGNTWIAYVDATSNYVALAKHADTAAWATWTIVDGDATFDNNNVGYEPYLTIIGKTVFVFYEEDDADTYHDIAYDIYDSSAQAWKGEQILAEATGAPGYQDVKARYSKFNFHDQRYLDVLYSDGTDIYWNVLDTRPQKVDDGSNFGVNGGTSRQIVRSNNGDYYAVIQDTINLKIEIWKSSDGFVWKEQDSANSITIQSDIPETVDAAIDSSGVINVVWDWDQITSNSIRLQQFFTSTGLWDTDPYTSIATDSNVSSAFDYVSIAIDSGDKIHIVYDNDYIDYILYKEDVDGSWSDYVIVDSSAASVNTLNIVINKNNIPEIVYVDPSILDLTVSVGDANDPSAFASYVVDANVNNTSGQTGVSMAADTLTGNTWVAYTDNTNYVALAKYTGDHTSSQWNGTYWNAITTKSDSGYEPSIAINGKDVYVFYDAQDAGVTDDIAYDVYDSIAGSWNGETILQTGTYNDVKAKWSFEWNNFGSNRIDYIFSDGTDIYYDYLYIRRKPGNIDNASDFGSMPGASRQTIRTSSGKLYAFLNDGGSCEVWKSVDNGVSWSEKGAGQTCTSGTSVSVAIDSADVLHLAYISGVNHRYRTFDTVTDSYTGSEETVNVAGSAAEEVAVAIDNSDKPHVILDIDDGSGNLSIEYSNRVSGSWKTPVVVESMSAAAGDCYIKPEIIINEDYKPEVVFLDVCTYADMMAEEGNANDAISFSEKIFTVSDISSATSLSSIGIDSGGNTWIAYKALTTGYISLIEHEDASAWGTWQPSISNSKVGNEPSLFIDGTDIYVIYEDDQDDLVYDMYDGSSWSGETVLEEHGALQDIKARWSYINNYDSTGTARVQTNTYYFDNSDNCAADAACQDPNSAWTSDTNAFDSLLDTEARTNAGGSTLSYYLRADGTNAPSTGGTIVTVKARIRGYTDDASDSLYASIFSDGLAQILGEPTVGYDINPYYGDYVTLSTPTGGWSWAKIQALEVKIWNDTALNNFGYADRVEVLVESTNTAFQNEIDYLYSDGTDVWFNRLALGGVQGTQDAIDTVPTGVENNMSAVSDSSDNVHLAYIDADADDSLPDTADQVSYKKWNGTSWGSATLIPATADDDQAYVSISLNTNSTDLNDIYVAWTDISADSDREIYYRQYDDSATSWQTIQNPETGGINTNMILNYSGDAKIFGHWTVGNSMLFMVNYEAFVTAAGGNTAPSTPQTPYVNNTSAQSGRATPVSGLTDHTPAFSAVYDDINTSDTATYYEIEVGSNTDWATAEMWDSGQTALAPAVNENSRSQDIDYPGGATALADGVTYYWRIRFWDNSGAAGTWSADQQFSMNNAPTVGVVSLNSGLDIDLTADTTKSVSFTATVTDLDGNADIVSATGKMYRSGVGESCSNDNNNCYTVATCSLTGCSGNSCTATCTAQVAFFADATDAGTYSAEYWMAWIQASDIPTETGANLSPTDTNDINSLLTISTTSPIAYSTVTPGGNSAEQNTVVTNVGNRTLDLRISGNNMCTDYPTCSGNQITVGNQEYSSASFTYGLGTDLTASPADFDANIAKSTVVPSNSAGTVYWIIGIPTNTLPGNYSGANTVTSVVSP